MKAVSFIVVAAFLSLGGVVCAQEVGGWPVAPPTMVTPSNVNPQVENPTMVTPASGNTQALNPTMVTPSNVNGQVENPTMVTPSNVNSAVENPKFITPTGEAMHPLGGQTIGSFSIPHESIPSFFF